MPKQILPSPKESEIQKSILDYLQILENQKKILFIRLNAGMIPILNPNGSWRMLKGAPAGWPDIIVWKPVKRYGQSVVSGRDYLMTYFLEVKRPHTGKQTPQQVSFEASVNRIGGSYHVVTSLNAVQRILNF